MKFNEHLPLGDPPDHSLLSADARPWVEWAVAGPTWCGLRFMFLWYGLRLYVGSPYYVWPASAHSTT